MGTQGGSCRPLPFLPPRFKARPKAAFFCSLNQKQKQKQLRAKRREKMG